MIIGEIKRYLRDNSTIRVSRSVRDIAYRALSVRELLLKKTNAEPTVDDIVKYMAENGEPKSKEDVVQSIALKEAISSLSPREKTILGMRFYKGKTQMEIASEIGISQAQVSRLEKGALERIKKQL